MLQRIYPSCRLSANPTDYAHNRINECILYRDFMGLTIIVIGASSILIGRKQSRVAKTS